MQSLFIVKNNVSGNFTPLQVETRPMAKTERDQKSSANFIISNESIEERNKYLEQINNLMTEKLKRRGKKTLDFLDKNRHKPNLVRTFLKKLLKIPKNSKVVEDGEIEADNESTKQIDTYTEKQSDLKAFIDEYISVSQLLFDLIPLVTYIYEDPYHLQSKEGKELLENYRDVANMSRHDLIQRIALKNISEVTPVDSTPKPRIMINRLIASAFAL